MKVLSVRRYKAGYEVRRELCSLEGYEGQFILKFAYTVPENYFIGDSVWAHRLIVQRGIKPEPRLPADPGANGGRGRTCTIGFCERKQEWAGWSHRAIAYFGIGDKIFESGFGDEDTPIVEHGEVTITTLEQAKQAAIEFAGFVG